MPYLCDFCGHPTDDAHTIGGIAKVFHTCKACQDRMDREYDYQSEGETYNERVLVCPHCQHEYEDYDAYQFEEGTTEEVVCEFCGKNSTWKLSTSGATAQSGACPKCPLTMGWMKRRMPRNEQSGNFRGRPCLRMRRA